MNAMRPPLATLLPVLAALCSIAFTGATAQAQNPTGIVWSTYVGGSAHDSPAMLGIGAAANGDALTWGWTGSTNFPTQGAYQTTYGGPTPASLAGLGDGYLTRVAADGSGLIWSTYLGGSGIDAILDVEEHPGGTITVCGTTASSNFVVTPGAFQATTAGGYDAFVARFAWNGQQLVLLWSTLLGGSGNDSATAVAVHPNGNVYVAGHSTSMDLPMAGSSFQPSNAGGADGFVAVLDGSGASLLASTYFGGSSDDFSLAAVAASPFEIVHQTSLELDAAGNPVIGGVTQSSNIQMTPDALQPNFGGGSADAVVAVLDPGLGQLIYGTYLGGTGWDYAWHTTLAPDGRIAVCGHTSSTDFPVTANCYDPTFNGGISLAAGADDAFVTLIDRHQPPSTQLSWSTYFGAASGDIAFMMRVDAAGLVTVAGMVADYGNSWTVPTTLGCFQSNHAGGVADGWFARFDPRRNGSAQLLYSTHAGGAGQESTMGVALDDRGNALIVERTNSWGSGGFDTFVAKLNLLPQDVVRYGSSVAACLHPIYQGVDSWPAPGNSTFTLMVHGAPANQLGAIALGIPAPGGVPLPFGLEALLNPVITTSLGIADARGSAELQVPIPSTFPGTPPYGIATQWFFLTTSACPGIGPAGSSEGLGF